MWVPWVVQNSYLSCSPAEAPERSFLVREPLRQLFYIALWQRANQTAWCCVVRLEVLVVANMLQTVACGSGIVVWPGIARINADATPPRSPPLTQRQRMLLIEQLQKSFQEPDGTKLPILNIPRYEVGAGEQVVLMGRSGSGKTTLLHIVSGITRPDRGSVKVTEVEITRLSEAQRDRFRAERIGYVFQTFNLLPAFTALENVLLGMSFTGQRPDVSRAKSLLDRVGLSHRLTHRPAALSVGEQQRVSVARSLANKPKLLLADEPTANVDPGHQQQIVDMLRENCEQDGVSLIVVTHTPEVASQFSRVDKLEDVNQIQSV